MKGYILIFTSVNNKLKEIIGIQTSTYVFHTQTHTHTHAYMLLLVLSLS